MPGIKDDFIAEILADLPEGIRDYLDAEVPEPPEVSMPTDVDSAILVNGVCAWYVLELFRPLAGLKLVQIPMFLGQLNTVNGGMLLASLEYDETSQAEQNFKVIQPQEGGTYYPGNVRLQAQCQNGNLIQIAVEMGDQLTAMDYDEDNGVFWGYVRAEDLGPYTITFTGLFEDDSTQEITVTITISDTVDPENPENDPEDPDGGDWWAVEMAKKTFDKAYTWVTKGGVIGIIAGKVADEITESDNEQVKAMTEQATNAAQAVVGAAKKVVQTVAETMVNNAINKILDMIEQIGTRDLSRGDPVVVGMDFDELVASLGELKSSVDGMYSDAYQRYMKLNQHPSTGYTSCPEVLTGAKEAMNEKYGPGTVSY